MVCWRDLQFMRGNMDQYAALYGDPNDPLVDESKIRLSKKRRESYKSNNIEYPQRQITKIEPEDN